MKWKKLQIGCVTILAGFSLVAPLTTSADSSTIWEAVSQYRPVKSTAELKSAKPGKTAVNVCNGCKRVVCVRSVSAGQGPASFNLEQCQSCGSTNTFTAVLERPVSK